MIVQLDRGRSRASGRDGRAPLQRGGIREMWTRADDPPDQRARRLGSRRCARTSRPTASGWCLRDYRGRKIVVRTPGGLLGLRLAGDARSRRVKLGVVVLTNQEEGGAFKAISLPRPRLIPRARPTTRLDRALRRARATGKSRPPRTVGEEGAAARAKRRRSRRCRSRSTPGATATRGTATSTIALEGGKLVHALRPHTPQLVGDLEHWQYDTFVARWRDRR